MRGDSCWNSTGNKTITIFVLIALFFWPEVCFSKMEQKPSSVEFETEVYTEGGVTIGCGLSYRVVWPGDKDQAIGISGSTNFYLNTPKKNVFALMKATGVINGSQKAIKYSWVETKQRGRSLQFLKGPSEDQQAFVGFHHSDFQDFTMPQDMARNGFLLGVSFSGLPIDYVAEVPSADTQTIEKLNQCFVELTNQMAAVFKQ